MKIYKIRNATDHEWKPCVWCGRQFSHGESITAFCDDNGFNVVYWVCHKCSGELLDIYSPDEFKDSYDPDFIIMGKGIEFYKMKKMEDAQIEIDRLSRHILYNCQSNLRKSVLICG